MKIFPAVLGASTVLTRTKSCINTVNGGHAGMVVLFLISIFEGFGRMLTWRIRARLNRISALKEIEHRNVCFEAMMALWSVSSFFSSATKGHFLVCYPIRHT